MSNTFDLQAFFQALAQHFPELSIQENAPQLPINTSVLPTLCYHLDQLASEATQLSVQILVQASTSPIVAFSAATLWLQQIQASAEALMPNYSCQLSKPQFIPALGQHTAMGLKAQITLVPVSQPLAI